jgi:hypothetical protein
VKTRIIARSAGSSAPAPEPDSTAVDLEKSWHCLQYLLSGDASLDERDFERSPLFGGDEIPDPDGRMPYGPARCVRAAEVPARARALAGFDWKGAIGRYDQDAAGAAGVYVAQHGAEELEHYADQVVRFFEDAARRGRAVISWVV